MAIKIEMLRSFCTVAETGNLAEAANRLGRTPSAVSMTLKQLEDHLGKKLFETERKNRLSPLGEQVFDLANKQLRQFDGTVQSIESSAIAPHGLVRIVSVPSVAAKVFPPVVAEMSARHPGLQIELRDTDSQQVIDALAQGQADIGIASGQRALNGMRELTLFEDPFGLVCAADHPLAKQPNDPTLDDVRDAGFIRNALCEEIELNRLHTVLGGARITVHNTLSLIAMVRHRDWVTILPKTVVGFVPDQLIFRPIQGLNETRKVSLYLREKSRFLEISQELAGLISAAV
ncbi:DNA-binding transcriptional regulator, LysR family [Shimia gijangensis]|uniref:DNA-binding transcriptional regulator, LysR family n=1 Tax=Shimia gijangensis TaxID=1470563 RepID=A0A1M6GGY8_9RHOB|nr:LysR family transcriptional regulator [Shimia gijangensis]SHJ09215.1 DNA-binding transcriptional regulator, LysR family [Shimia gijangensis]